MTSTATKLKIAVVLVLGTAVTALWLRPHRPRVDSAAPAASASVPTPAVITPLVAAERQPAQPLQGAASADSAGLLAQAEAALEAQDLDLAHRLSLALLQREPGDGAAFKLYHQWFSLYRVTNPDKLAASDLEEGLKLVQASLADHQHNQGEVIAFALTLAGEAERLSPELGSQITAAALASVKLAASHADDPLLHEGIGWLSERQQQVQPAIEAFEAAKAGGQLSAAATGKLADLYGGTGRLKEAIAAYSDAFATLCKETASAGLATQQAMVQAQRAQWERKLTAINAAGLPAACNQ